MKTLLVLTLLVTLVGLGVWNSPKAAQDEGYSVVRTMKLTGEVLTIPSVMIDDGMEYRPVKTEEIAANFLDSLGGEVTVLSDGTITGKPAWQREGTKEWAEWWGEGTPQWAEYTAGRVKTESVPWMRYTGGRVKTADEIAKQQAEWAGEEYGNVFLPGAEMQDVSTYRNATPMGENAPENHEMAYSGLLERSHWQHALSSKSAPDGDRHAY